MKSGIAEIKKLYIDLYGYADVDFDSENINREIDLITTHPKARELIKELSPYGIAELMIYSTEDFLDNLLSTLTNEKLKQVVALIPHNKSTSILKNISSPGQAQRFSNIIKQFSQNYDGVEIPAFLRKSNLLTENIEIVKNIDRIDSSTHIKTEDIYLLEKLKEENRVLLNKIRSDDENFKILLKQRDASANEKILLMESEYKDKYKELELQYSELIQKRIDENLTKYVNSAVLTLESIEKKLNFSAGLWSFIAASIVAITLCVGIGFSLFGYYFGPPLLSLQWPELLIVSLKGFIIISALAAAAAFSFKKSNSYTHESLIVSNRAHAIQFGKLYLEIYGNTVERSEMVKIFENWNISSDTAFFNRNTHGNSINISDSLELIKKFKEVGSFSNS